MTGPLLAGLAGAGLIGGLWLIVAGMRKVPVRAVSPRSGPGLGGQLRRSQATGLAFAVLVGVLFGLFTGWWIAIVLLPGAMLVLPPLLRPASTAKIDRLEAVEEWSRSLAGVLTAGVGLEQAILVSLRSTPEPIRPEVSALVGRLRARWSTEDALRAFADDMDDATGDLVAAKLVLASRRRGPGLAAVLESLAESVAADVRARRQIEADRAKPRAAVRWVTLITVLMVVLLSFNGAYMAPYRTPVGQAVLALLLGADLLCLLMMQSMTRVAPLPRFIGRTAQREGA